MTIKNTSASGTGLHPASIEELVESLLPFDSQFDHSAAMLAGQVYEIRYHTKLAPGTPVHLTRESAEYASALLETNEEWRVRRATDILIALVALQDSREDSKTYGLWPWFLEEPLDEMSPPDWNWADFVGTQLAQILWRADLDFASRKAVELALFHAARSIIRRDVTMSYTNIAIMGTYVTVMAGTILRNAEILEYGRKRLARFRSFTDTWGGFPEYNSPNYTVIALTELTRMLRDFPREDDRSVVRHLHNLVWKEVAIHWHAFSRQWSGPHSRSYQTLLSPAILGFLQRGLSPHVTLLQSHLPTPQEIVLPLRCPDEYLSYFSDQQLVGTHRQRAIEGEPALDAVSYFSKKFTISSVERGTFWNQSRAIVAYSQNARGPTALHVRTLRDGYDYSSANIISAQHDANILGAICFANDGGNLHCSLDRNRNAPVEASDWRLRFQWHGFVELQEDPGKFSTEQIVNFELADDVVISARIPWVAFGNDTPLWEVTLDDASGGLDLVLYRGPRRIFTFDGDFPCVFGLALTVNNAAALETVRADVRDGNLFLEWPLPAGKNLRAAGSLVASGEMEITSFSRQQKEQACDQ